MCIIRKISIAVATAACIIFGAVGAARAVTLTFDETKLGFDPTVAPRFSLDNLSYTAVPEASSLFGLLAFGALAGATFALVT